jgi:glucosyl-3-phosphoglycerate synthase
MAGEIAEELFQQCAAEGMAVGEAFREAVATAYRREGQLAVQRSASLALINDLPFDEAAESKMVEAFAKVLRG